MLKLKKGFTLIELLVVITIIGILATGATAIYTSQIQKSRDSTRLTSLKAFQGGLEQAFGDLAYYPGVANTTATPADINDCTNSSADTSNLDCLTLLGYIQALPKDPKTGQGGNGSALDYTYAVAPLDGVDKQIYEVSMGVEANGQKVKAGSGSDSGNDDNRYEAGMTNKGINTRTNASTAEGGAALNTAMSNSIATKISGTFSCHNAAGTNPQINNDTAVGNIQSSVMIVRGKCN